MPYVMSQRDFFIQRYREMGWHYREPQVKQAIRVNTMNIDEEQLVNRLAAHGFRLQRIPFLKSGYWITEAKFSIGAAVEYLLGYYSIQEAAAQIPVSLFTDLKGKKVLDACAAPGGKTVQLANLMEGTGVIVALDVKRSRIQALRNQLERCRVNNALIYQLDARKASKLGLKFDRILLDVPCSGNFATDKEWFRRRTMRDILRNSKIQREILAEAAEILKDDGEIIYSTCSLEPEENEFNIDWAVKNLNLQVIDVEAYGERAKTEIFGEKLSESIAGCRRIWPGETQGFFLCKLIKAKRTG